MALEIARFVNLLLAGLFVGNEFGIWAAALPVVPLPSREEEDAHGVTVSSAQEKRGASS